VSIFCRRSEDQLFSAVASDGNFHLPHSGMQVYLGRGGVAVRASAVPLEFHEVRMSFPELALRTARKHVENFADENTALAAHVEAMECLDCEAFLDLGIDAFSWLRKATKVVRTEALHEDSEAIERAESSLQQSRKAWLRTCDLAETWIAVQLTRGFVLGNLDEFRRCGAAMRQIVAIDEQREAISQQVPPAELLGKMAIPVPQEWIDEPTWSPEPSAGADP
jgi:hypothetical protein